MADAQTTLAGIVGEAVGPLPRVCAEQVLQDLERARMMAEDFRDGNAVCNIQGATWRQRVAQLTDRIAALQDELEELDAQTSAYIIALHDQANTHIAQTRADSRTLTNVIAIVREADGGTAQEQEDALAQIRLELGMDNMDVSQE